MNVVLDANILIADPHRSKASTKTLSRLARDWGVVIHIPELAEKEFLSRRRREINEKFDSLSKPLTFLDRLSTTRRELDLARRIKSDVEEIHSILISREISDYNSWKKIHGVNVIDISLSSPSEVFSDYFSLHPPFLVPSDRRNIPDAFIISSIKKYFSKNSKDVIVISNDSAFRDCLEGNFKTFSSIDEALKDGDLSKIIESSLSDKEQETLDLIRGQLKWHLTYLEINCSKAIMDEAESYFEYDFDGSYASYLEDIQFNITENTPTYLGQGKFSMLLIGTIGVATTIVLDKADKALIKEHLDEDYEFREENEDFVEMYKYSFERFTTKVIVEFNLDDMRSGRILKSGLALGIYTASIEIEDITFMSSY